MRSLLDPKSTVVRLASGQSAESLSFREGQRSNMRVNSSPTDLLNVVTLLGHYGKKKPQKSSQQSHSAAGGRREKEHGRGFQSDARKSSYLNPILLYPAKFAYQRETGLSHLERVLEERT